MVIASNPYFYRSHNFHLHEEDDWQCSAPTAQNRRCRNSKSGYSASKYWNLEGRTADDRRAHIKAIILDRLCSRWHRGAMLEVPKLLDELAIQYEHDHFPESCQCCEAARRSQQRDEEAIRQAAWAAQRSLMVSQQALTCNAQIATKAAHPASLPVVSAPPTRSCQQPATQAVYGQSVDDVSIISDTSISDPSIEDSSDWDNAGFDETEYTDIGIAIFSDKTPTQLATADVFECDDKPDVASISASASTAEPVETPPTEAETSNVTGNLTAAVANDDNGIVLLSPASAMEMIPSTFPASLMGMLQTDVPPQFDQPGAVYAFTWSGAPGHVQIAHAPDSNDTRMAQWQHCFPGSRELWKLQCRYPARMEKLVHQHLQAQRRVMIGCPHCTTDHSDWLCVTEEEAVAAMRLWANVLSRAELYTVSGQLCLYWKDIVRGAVEDGEVLGRLHKEVLQLKDGPYEPQVVLRYPQHDCKTWEGRLISLVQILGALWTLAQIVLR